MVDFPLLDFDPEEKRFVACHHPFTMPKDEYVDGLISGEEKTFREIKARPDFIQLVILDLDKK